MISTSLGGSSLIFVGGPARSGTTLIQNMLDSHPLILGGPEFLHLPELVKARNNMRHNVERGWIDQICTHEDVDERFRTLILEFLEPFAKRHGKQILSEKTPENILVFQELAELLPGARFILIVRDPRAIAASMLEVGKRGRKSGENVPRFTRNAAEAVRYIKKCYTSGFAAAKRYPERVLILQYEQVVKDPAGATRQMSQFLGIEQDASMNNPAGQKHLGERAITTNSSELWYTAGEYSSNPHTASLDKWKSSLRPRDIASISLAFRDFKPLAKFGYDFALTGMSLTNRLMGYTLAYSTNSAQSAFARLARGVRRLSA